MTAMKINFIVLKLLTIQCFFIYTSILTAQSDPPHAISVSGNVDIVSRYIWRGLEFGQSPSIQPALSAKWKDFTLGAWGAYKLTGAGDQETDFFLTKKIGFLTVGVSDYWTFSDTAAMDFFNYREKTTAHILETQVLLSGGESLPFNLLACYFFYGADTTESIYLELQYLHSSNLMDMLFFAGYQPKGEYYGSKNSFVNIGCTARKSIAVTDRWSLPLSISLILNPDRKSVYLVAGITL